MAPTQKRNRKRMGWLLGEVTDPPMQKGGGLGRNVRRGGAKSRIDFKKGKERATNRETRKLGRNGRGT